MRFGSLRSPCGIRWMTPFGGARESPLSRDAEAGGRPRSVCASSSTCLPVRATSPSRSRHGGETVIGFGARSAPFRSRTAHPGTTGPLTAPCVRAISSARRPPSPVTSTWPGHPACRSSSRCSPHCPVWASTTSTRRRCALSAGAIPETSLSEMAAISPVCSPGWQTEIRRSWNGSCVISPPWWTGWRGSTFDGSAPTIGWSSYNAPARRTGPLASSRSPCRTGRCALWAF